MEQVLLMFSGETGVGVHACVRACVRAHVQLISTVMLHSKSNSSTCGVIIA